VLGLCKKKVKIQDVKERCVERTVEGAQNELELLKYKTNQYRLVLRENYNEINLRLFKEGLLEEGKDEHEIDEAKLKWGVGKRIRKCMNSHWIGRNQVICIGIMPLI
jgi:hypothetical protein